MTEPFPDAKQQPAAVSPSETPRASPRSAVRVYPAPQRRPAHLRWVVAGGVLVAWAVTAIAFFLR